MRKVVLVALALCVVPVVGYAEEPAAVDRAAVVAACAQLTVLPEGTTADEATMAAYCQCAIDRTAEALTVAEFNLFARIGLARAGMGPMPSDEDALDIDVSAFDAKVTALRATLEIECNPIIFAPRESRE